MEGVQMSNLQNTIYVEDLVSRMEALKGAMSVFEYQDKQGSLITMFAAGEFEEAAELVSMLEERHAGDLADLLHDEKLASEVY